MAAKQKAKPKPKVKSAARPAGRAKKAAAGKKIEGLRCEVCGLRVIIDEACGCVEEHVLLCCDRPMAKTKIAR